MFRTGLFILLTSITATLFGAWSAAYFFPTLAPTPMLWLFGGLIDGFGYALILFLTATLFPSTFFAAFPATRAKKTSL